LLVKLSPDLTHTRRAEVLRAVGGAAAGVIVSNTTTIRVGVRSRGAMDEGGLSGDPLRPLSLAAVAEARRVAGDGLRVVASGGIGSGADAGDALAAGADLVQLWTGMIYAGPGLIGEAVRATRGALDGRRAPASMRAD
jgi:dihydroorotate dehydrogenase